MNQQTVLNTRMFPVKKSLQAVLAQALLLPEDLQTPQPMSQVTIRSTPRPEHGVSVHLPRPMARLAVK